MALLLLKRRASPNAIDVDGQLPLHRAQIAGHVATTNVLLSYGGSVGRQDRAGNTALHVAVKNYNAKGVYYKHQHDVSVTHVVVPTL